MLIEQTNLEGCFIITPQVFEDERGVFLETFNKQLFEKQTGLSIDFVQDNQSVSRKGVLRGLHFQIGDHAQAKLVRVLRGKVLDVCVDVRKDSLTFGEHFSIHLDSDDNKQLFIPKGLAHGFLSLEDNTIFNYKCDNYYNKTSETGIVFNDKTLAINWNYPEEDLILSKKDKILPTFETYFK